MKHYPVQYFIVFIAVAVFICLVQIIIKSTGTGYAELTRQNAVTVLSGINISMFFLISRFIIRIRKMEKKMNCWRRKKTSKKAVKGHSIKNSKKSIAI